MLASVRRIWIVARKELTDTLRDSRTLVLAVVLPLVLYPVIFLTIGRVTAGNELRQREAKLEVAVVGSPEAPGLLPSLAQSKQLIAMPADVDPDIVRQHLVDAVIVVPPAHEALVLAGGESTIRVYYDETDALSRRARTTIEAALARYRESLLVEQLSRLGGDGRLLAAARSESMNVATAQDMGAYILGSLVPYLLVLLIASAASHIAIDTTAGEKERSTLETILVSGATRGELLLGKFLATFATAAVAGAMGLTGLILTLIAPMSARAFSGEEFSLPAWSVGVLLIMILPVALLMSSILLAFGCFARSAREGQTFATYFVMCVAVLAVMAVVSEVEPKPQLLLMPIIGTTQVQRQILSGTAEPSDILLTIFSTVVMGGIALAMALRLFANERVMFRK
jgi:sodium transport system permease protein